MLVIKLVVISGQLRTICELCNTTGYKLIKEKGRCTFRDSFAPTEKHSEDTSLRIRRTARVVIRARQLNR